MARIEISFDIPTPLPAVWDALIDWEAHSAWIPNTAVTILERSSDSTTQVGTRFVGTTRIGPLRFDDPMTVSDYHPPAEFDGHAASCTVTKTGPLLGGTAGFTLTRIDDQHTNLVWFEHIYLQPAIYFWWTAPFIRIIGKAAFTRALRTMIAQLPKH